MSTLRNEYKLTWGPNLSYTNRQLRIIIGTLMIITTLFLSPAPIGMWSLVLLAAIPLVFTAITGWDPIYSLAGISGYKQGEEDIQQKSWTCPNIGTLDRTVRLGLGIVLLSTLLTMTQMQTGLIVTLFAIPLIMTALIAWDPIYAVTGINSFASRVDVEAAEPEVSDKTLATFYVFPKQQRTNDFPKAA